ncbi:MAG: DNA replication/repair protein RecF [Methylococcales bacterium]|jgi:DNA replication and repair protein RecF|nr:DNA replication/repair protein RecF [Methylococcales bacterium]MBT7445037.1 DNA replication/repair protein RecF [Methylococcales bacterium]
MTIEQLNLTNFRSIKAASIEPSSRLNLITGNNGSGKTTLMEAIYYLGRGKSFKTSKNSKIISTGEDSFTLYSQLSGSPATTIGIQKSKTTSTVKLNGQTINSSSKLAQYCPLLLIHPESHHLLEQGPQQRRHFMNWGLFHVEHAFLPLWNQYSQVLKQRNALLRNRDVSAIKPWDIQFVELSEKIDLLRQHYVSKVNAYFTASCHSLLGLEDINLVYRRGWNQESQLADLLASSTLRDIESGFTRAGPHRADISIVHDKQNVHQIVSRGQQKLIITALLLSQAQYLDEMKQQKAIILVDDLTSELDQHHLQKLYEIIMGLDTQVFITAISDNFTSGVKIPSHSKMFHVEHGHLNAI